MYKHMIIASCFAPRSYLLIIRCIIRTESHHESRYALCRQHSGSLITSIYGSLAGVGLMHIYGSRKVSMFILTKRYIKRENITPEIVRFPEEVDLLSQCTATLSPISAMPHLLGRGIIIGADDAGRSA